MIQYYIEAILEVRRGNQIIERDEKLFLIKDNNVIKIDKNDVGRPERDYNSISGR